MCRVSKFCLNSQDMFVRALKWMKWVYVRALGQLNTSNAALKAKRLPPSATPPAFQPWNQEEEDVDHAICEEGIIETNCFCCFHLKLSGKNSDKAIFPLFSGPFYRWLPKSYPYPSPIPPHICCRNWRKIQICPPCCNGSLMSDDTSFSYLWALAVSSPPPMQRPPMNTRGTDDAPVSWGSK